MRRLVMTVVALALSTGSAPAQERPAAPQPPCAPGTICPEGSPDGQTLSEQLEDSDGVIAPPTSPFPTREVVPPDPNPQTTPVIEPEDVPAQTDPRRR